MRKVVLPLIVGGLVLSFSAAHGTGVQASNPGLTPPPPPPGPSTPVVPPPAPGATATATAVPFTLRVTLAQRVLAPTHKQTVTAFTSPGTRVHATVTFPDGTQVQHTAPAGPLGKMIWRYVQPGNHVTHTTRVARVVAVATASRTLKATAQYTVGFGFIDITTSPHRQHAGKSVTIWVHSYRNASVTVRLARGTSTLKSLPLRTGSSGWLQLRYVIPPHTARGAITVSATVPRGKGKATATTTFTVQ